MAAAGDPIPDSSLLSLQKPQPLFFFSTERKSETPSSVFRTTKHMDATEFQGFFVNSKPPSSAVKSYSGEGDSRTVQVKLLPDCVVILSSRSHETYALVLKVKAPSPLPPPRSNTDPLLDSFSPTHVTLSRIKERESKY